MAEAAEQRAALAPTEELAAQVDRLKTALAERRVAVIAARSEHDRLTREAAARAARLDAIATESTSWHERARGTAQRLADLDQRRIAGEAETTALAQKPAEIEAKRAVLLEAIGRAEANRTTCADRLAEAESTLPRPTACSRPPRRRRRARARRGSAPRAMPSRPCATPKRSPSACRSGSNRPRTRSGSSPG
ncbi:MAG: hypothetical protein WDO24_31135 [Pseudomonadota bacterium]